MIMYTVLSDFEKMLTPNFRQLGRLFTIVLALPVLYLEVGV